jgi:hypothetical protein
VPINDHNSRKEQFMSSDAVAPGPIWTPLIPATMPESKVESHGQEVPLHNLPRSLPPTSFSPPRSPATSLLKFWASPVVSP